MQTHAQQCAERLRTVEKECQHLQLDVQKFTTQLETLESNQSQNQISNQAYEEIKRKLNKANLTTENLQTSLEDKQTDFEYACDKSKDVAQELKVAQAELKALKEQYAKVKVSVPSIY